MQLFVFRGVGGSATSGKITFRSHKSTNMNIILKNQLALNILGNVQQLCNPF